MQLHELNPEHKNKTKKRIGRGGKRGTYSGRGMKGQNARAGRKLRPAIRDLIQQLPKLRGSKNFGPRHKKKKRVSSDSSPKQEKSEQKDVQ